MNRAVGYFVAAFGGLVVGSISTALYLTRKHHEELKDMRAEMHAWYKTRLSEQTEKATSETLEAMEVVKAELEALRSEKNDGELFARIGAELGREPTKKEVEVQSARAYVIRPDEFGNKGYQVFKYIFFPDQGEYLNSDCQTLVGLDEIEDMLGGIKPDEHFGEFLDEVVYVRNDDLKVDIVVYLEDNAPDKDEED